MSGTQSTYLDPIKAVIILRLLGLASLGAPPNLHKKLRGFMKRLESYENVVNPSGVTRSWQFAGGIMNNEEWNEQLEMEGDDFHCVGLGWYLIKIAYAMLDTWTHVPLSTEAWTELSSSLIESFDALRGNGELMFADCPVPELGLQKLPDAVANSSDLSTLCAQPGWSDSYTLESKDESNGSQKPTPAASTTQPPESLVSVLPAASIGSADSTAMLDGMKTRILYMLLKLALLLAPSDLRTKLEGILQTVSNLYTDVVVDLHDFCKDFHLTGHTVDDHGWDVMLDNAKETPCVGLALYVIRVVCAMLETWTHVQLSTSAWTVHIRLLVKALEDLRSYNDTPTTHGQHSFVSVGSVGSVDSVGSPAPPEHGRKRKSSYEKTTALSGCLLR